jgi:hypothetical protein
VKTTIRLLLALAVTVATTAKASAHHCCHRGYSYSMPMAPMGFGMMPMGFGAFPAAPAAIGSGFSMNMAMSGDASMALLMFPLLRGLLDRITPVLSSGALGTGGTEAATILRALEALPRRMNSMESGINQLNRDLADLFDQLGRRPRRTPPSPMGGSSDEVRSTQPSPELLRAEAELKKVMAKIEAGQKEMGVPVRTVKGANPEAELKRLMAEIKARRAEWNAPSPPVAVSSK